MKVGLLECDHVRDELIHIAGDYRQMFPALFLQVAPDWKFIFYDVCNGHLPAGVAECDIYICTGSRFSVYDDEDWIQQLKAFVREIYNEGKIYLGVCFGHQMLAEALGGRVSKSEKGWCVGVHPFEIIQTKSWMKPETPELRLLMMCQDQVIHLPPDSNVLATSADCPVAMFTVGNNMLGVQAHPEFTVGYDQALMELRVERIGAEKVARGIQSLQGQVHGLVMAEWMKNFAGAMEK